jgi:hypothetical protein
MNRVINRVKYDSMLGITEISQYPQQTVGTRVPPNVKFEVDDIENEWTYNLPFDFIHCRAMAAVIANWPRLVKQCFQWGTHLSVMEICV